MNHKPACLVALLGLLLLPACGPRQEGATAQASAHFDLAAARSVIEQKNAEFTKAHVDFLAIGVKAFTERTTDLYGTSELLIDQGEYEITYGPDNTVERGKYLNVWKQEDGTWKIHANIWNTSPAAAGLK